MFFIVATPENDVNLHFIASFAQVREYNKYMDETNSEERIRRAAAIKVQIETNEVCIARLAPVSTEAVRALIEFNARLLTELIEIT